MNYGAVVDGLAASGNLRVLPPDASLLPDVVDLSSNDYLGIAGDVELRTSFFAEAALNGLAMTSSASRLLAGNQNEYYLLEDMLGRLYGGCALLFNSGYHANVGLMSSLVDKRTLVVADRLVHASIIDGIMLSKADFVRFRHNDYGHLRQIMEKKARDYGSVIIVAESVYSMDGDRADIDALVSVKRDYPDTLLYIDEAHALGVEGPGGLGLVAASMSRDYVDVIVGTFGKALASSGAFCATRKDIKNFLVNHARSLIFSTALPPVTVAWTRKVFGRVLGMDSARMQLKKLSHALNGILSSYGNSGAVVSHIQPLIIGDPVKTVSLSQRLFDKGYKVLPIRRPTVSPGTERLRFSLSASISMEQVDLLGNVMKDCYAI